MLTPPPKDKLSRQHLRPRHGMSESVHLLDRDSALAINAALTSRRPLLVRGEPGVGKSQLARAAADMLNRSLVTCTVNSRTETNELLWHTDLVARLAEAQIAGGGGDRTRLALGRFVRPGPLWWGLDWAGAQAQLEVYHRALAGLPDDAPVDVAPPDTPRPAGSVVLIDELDKADSAIPNGLLDALGHRGFDVPGVKRVCLQKDSTGKEKPWPLVIFTTNEERHLPEAFLRRCFVLPLTLPTAQTALEGVLVQRGLAHFGPDRPGDRESRGKELGLAVIKEAAEAIASDRAEHQGDRRYRPGVAEFLDLLAAIQPADDPSALLEEVMQFALNKQAIRG